MASSSVSREHLQLGIQVNLKDDGTTLLLLAFQHRSRPRQYLVRMASISFTREHLQLGISPLQYQPDIQCRPSGSNA